MAAVQDLVRAAGLRRRRLLRRRAIARVLGVMVLALVLALFLPRMVRVMARPAREPAPVQVVVQPGDTLWSVAGRFAAGRDTRRVVWEIRRANGLEGATIYPGTVLVIPDGLGGE